MKKKLLTMTIMALLLIFASCEKNDNDVYNSKPKNPEDDDPNRIYETSCSKGKLTIQFGDTE